MRQLSRWIAVLLSSAVLLSIHCGGTSPPPDASTPASKSRTQPALAASTAPAQQRLSNGLYAVLAESPTREGLAAPTRPHVVLVDDGRFTGDTSPPRWLALGTEGFVPLILEGEPHTEPDGRGHALLAVTLARQHKKTLESFTRDHLGGRAAIVLDGEVVTVHKIKTVIDGGRMQITRCEDNACVMLRSKLVE